jgi:hypothetical protein
MRVSIKNISEFLVVYFVLTNLFQYSLINFLSRYFALKWLFLSTHCLFYTISYASQTDYFATNQLAYLV